MDLVFEVCRKKVLDALNVLQDCIKNLVGWFSSSSGTMDFQTSIICAIVFVVSALVVYLISVFGMRERTYEEAIEEQRQRNKEAIQQAKSDKTKKEKKFKKWGKKGREKVDDDKPLTCTDIEDKVEHETDFMVGEVEGNVTNIDQKNKCFVSRRKIKLTALLSSNKEDAVSQMPSSSEENDEQHSTSRSSSSSPQKDELVAIAMPKILKSKTNYIEDNFAKHSDGQPIDGDHVDKVFSDVFAFNESDSSVLKSFSNQKEDKASSFALSDTQIEFNKKLISALKAACLSTEDLSELRSLLTCRELPPCSMKYEVNSGNDETEVKVKDLCQKLSQERSRAAATESFLREKLNQQRQELQSLQDKIRRSHEQQLAGSSSVKIKIQQMKTKLTEEHSCIVQKLQEEKNQLQQAYNILESEKQKCNSIEVSRLQHEIGQSRTSREEYETQLATMQQTQDDLHRQIQQLEKHIEQVVKSKQDEEFSLKQRVSELSSKLQQSEKSQGPLVQELKNAQTVCGNLETDNASLRKRLEDAKQQIGNMEQDVHKLQSKLEESHQQQRELANCLEQMKNEVIDLKNIQNDHVQQIEDLKQENQSIASQLAGAEKIISPEAAEIHHQSSENPKNQEIELEEHLKMIQEKDTFLLHYSEELSKSEANLLMVSDEVEYLKLQNQELQEKYRKVTDTLSITEKKLQEVAKTLEDKEKGLSIILNQKSEEVEQVLHERHKKEIDSKNDEIRTLQMESRNKVAASEGRVEELEKLFYQRVNEVEVEAERRVHEMLKRSEHILSLLKRDREVLKKMFPDINISGSLDHETWILQFEERAIKYVMELKESCLSVPELNDKENLLKQLTEALEEKSKFELCAKHYKNALVDTGNILSKLQNTAEMEEKLFKQKLMTLEMELKKVLSEYKKLSADKNALNNDVEQLQTQQKLKIKFDELKSELKFKEEQNLEAEKRINEMKIEMNNLQSKLSCEEHKKRVIKTEFNVSPISTLVDNSSTEQCIPVSSGQATVSVTGNYPTKSEKRKKSKKKGSSGKK